MAVTGPERLRATQVVDVVVASALFSLAAWEVLRGPVAEDVVNGPTWLNLVAVALTTLPVAFRSRAPLAAAVVVYVALAGRALLAEPLELYPPMLAAIIVTYTVAVTGTVRRTAAVLALAAAAIVVTWLRGSGDRRHAAAVAQPGAAGDRRHGGRRRGGARRTGPRDGGASRRARGAGPRRRRRGAGDASRTSCTTPSPTAWR